MPETARIYCVLMAGPFTHTETLDCLLQMLMVNSEIITEFSSWKGTDGIDGHNNAAAETLAGDFTHLLLIDRDHEFPADLVTRLLAHDRDIVGATYRRRGPPFDVLLRTAEPVRLDEMGIVDALRVPSGMMLIKRQVFEAMTYPWFYKRHGAAPADVWSDDHVFVAAARDLGFGAFIDLGLSRECSHIVPIPLKIQ